MTTNTEPQISPLNQITIGGRVLVTGGRRNYDWLPLWIMLDKLEPSLLIEGGATGWDEGAYRWAEYHKTRLKTVAASWDSLGTASGHLRNLHMLDHWRPDVVLCGTGGVGTQHCIKAALARRIPCIGLRATCVPHLIRNPSEY